MDGFDEAVGRYHVALGGFMMGDPRPVTELFSDRSEVVLCNPLQPIAHGPAAVAEAIRQAASHVDDGACEIEVIEKQRTPELGYVVEIERFTARVDGREGSGALRVTMILRPEDGVWKVVHRHADPITTPRVARSMLDG